ncbi:dipeptidase [Nocardioides mangrovicus]|uniref:D-alanyl-D-alanine dipeptidase n=2 Tax=Nocardioides mangrovicus TaxID=2478913 RepID=A0A3L8NYZ5_9ACTN|nr:dipeptidase [Nocardioides mangrovicus]
MADERVSAIPVVDNGDKMVDVRLGGIAYDGADEAGAWLRVGLARRLRVADLALGEDLRLLVREGFRPAALQEQYFERYRRGLLAADPSLSQESSVMLASRFISPPAVAPHVSGAAVDLTLADHLGQPLDLGTPIDATPEESEGACYFAAENVGGTARQNRETLALALQSAGLVNYPTEWWHWSYGDRYWALSTGRPAAVYGPVGSGR